MNDRRLVHTVEFLAMNLVGIQDRRVDERQALAAAEHGCFAHATDPRQHVEDLTTPRRRQASHSDGQCVRDERLGC
jgi:hypothetical protein